MQFGHTTVASMGCAQPWRMQMRGMCGAGRCDQSAASASGGDGERCRPRFVDDDDDDDEDAAAAALGTDGAASERVMGPAAAAAAGATGATYGLGMYGAAAAAATASGRCLPRFADDDGGGISACVCVFFAFLC